MAIRDIDRVLHFLEENAEDELSLLESTGPEYFTTAHLWKLRGQWEIKNQLFRHFQQTLLHIAAFSPIWLLGWMLFYWMGWTYLALLSLFLFPVSFIIFFAGLYYLRRFFKGKGHLDGTGEMIVDALRRRSDR